MAKPNRSPVLGYNHNVRYHGRVFHVQTEDSGPLTPRLFTHLFFAGTILSSKKHEYDGSEHEDTVKGLMQRLHKAMIKELTHGDHDPRIAAFFGARGEPAVLEDPANAPAAPAPVAPAPLSPSDFKPGDLRPAEVRTISVSGSIDTQIQRTPVPAVPSPGAVPAVMVSAGTAPMPIPSSPAPLPVAAAPVAPVQPPPRPQVTPRPVVMRPGDTKRPPVTLSSSADGAVVQRNVVINVGGGSPPVNAHRERGTRPRPSVPYVVRDGGYPLPTATRVPGGGAPAQPRLDETQPIVSPGREVRNPRDPARAADATARARAPGAPTERTPRPGGPSERTPAERGFSDSLAGEKRLEEVILEYLSDDTEGEE